MKDYIGNTRSAFATLGARNYALEDREVNDYYATEPKAVKELLKIETFDQNVWECACGAGHLSKVLAAHGYTVKSTDLIDRGYGVGGIDFLKTPTESWCGDIVTNPPYKYGMEFVQTALGAIRQGHKVAMFLKLQFLEGKKRWDGLFKISPPHTIYVSSSRLTCAKNGDFEHSNRSPIAYAWFIWVKGYAGDPTVKWFN